MHFCPLSRFQDISSPLNQVRIKKNFGGFLVGADFLNNCQEEALSNRTNALIFEFLNACLNEFIRSD
jgi:hypothetical protein